MEKLEEEIRDLKIKAFDLFMELQRLSAIHQQILTTIQQKELEVRQAILAKTD